MASFDGSTRPMFDKCAGVGKDVVNSSVFDYTMSSFRAANDDKLSDFITSNKNLHMTGARGPEPDLIDVESTLRNNIEMTHDKERNQLSVRTFLAHPNLDRGGVMPTLEHVLQSGHACTSVRESMYAEFPMNNSVAHMVRANNLALNSWDSMSIGENSKDILRRMKHGQK